MSKRLRCRLLVRLTHQLTGLAEEKIEETHAAQTSLKTTTEGAVNVNEALAATLAAARTSLQNNLEVLDASTARLKDAIVLRDSAERATGKLEAVNEIYVEQFGDLSKLMNVAETTSKKLRETTKLCEDKTTKAKRKMSSLLDNHDAKLNQATNLHKTAVAGADVLAKEMNDVREKVSTTKRDVTTAIKQEKVSTLQSMENLTLEHIQSAGSDCTGIDARLESLVGLLRGGLYNTTAMAHENRCPKSRKIPMSGTGSRITRPSTTNKKAFAATVDPRRCESAFTEGAVAQPDDATTATMKAQAVTARTRCRQTFDTDVEESRRKNDWGAPTSYPRRGDHSSPPNRRHPVYEPRRRISKAAATRLGDARGSTYDITGVKARTFTSLQKKDRRLARGDREHSRRGRALNSAGVPPAALGVPTTLSPSPSTPTLSPTPGWEVASFVPDRIEIPDVPGDNIMVLGKIPVPQHLLVDFLTKSHHPLVYSCRDRVVTTPVGAPRDDRPSVPMEANASTTSSVDAKPPPMAKPITTAGPAMPSSIAEPTPAAGPTVPSPTVETTPESGPAVSSSIAEPTPVAESAAEAPSSLAEPPPPPTEPVAGPDHAPGDGNNWPTPVEASLGSFVRDDAASVPMPDETARPSAMPSRPGDKRSPAGPAGTEEVAAVLPSIGEAGPFSSWDTEGLIRSYDTEDDGLYSPRVRHRKQMKRYDSTLDRGCRRLYSPRHRKADENTARRESRCEAPTAGIAAAAPSPTELMSADGANACTASTAFDGLDQAPPQVEAPTAGSADAALSPTAALPTVAPDADTVPLWASAPDSDSTGFRDGWTSRVSCSRRGGKTNAASTSVADPAHTNKDPHTGRTLEEAYLGSKVQDGAAPMTLTGMTAGAETMDEVGHVNTIEADDDDWVIVNTPALPTNPWGGIDFTRVDLANVELVPSNKWFANLWPWNYGDDDALVTASDNARRPLLIKYLKRQLQADRVLSLNTCGFGLLWYRARTEYCADLGRIDMTPGDTQLARDRGFTRIWDEDYVVDNNGHRRYFLRDKRRYE
ncbi:hypothetical protein THAOC_34907 [Thalassiosira oceanica]|uniref:Uncharacterized protein n=1 Tax=Thalassiosira oceanica TaxID=159749 RepID=K0R2P8_THAOC|nr:hypothetical protein THAOC_34907 [Thalassiosira oceanica]|eukprot:EJK46425.1 hypothetical protein THAOC_34907 [Thalassiosira oceanica]